jgi:pimeloyl-ACP methyl ester carboxylesterase
VSDADVQRREFDLPDGRRLEAFLVGWADTDDGAGVVVDHHGTPGCGHPSRLLVAAAAARGLRILAPTRPGYGASTPQPGRNVAAVAGDVAVLLDQLGVATAAVFGGSGGGPHSLATAALLPHRITAAATIAGVGPFGGPGLDFLAGMGQENIDEFGAALAGESELRAFLEAERPNVLAATAHQIAESMITLLPPVDVAVMTGVMADDVVATFSGALRPGIEGWLGDDLAFTRPWGFELSALAAVPVTIWQGELDQMVPAAHGRWLAEQLPHATVHLLPDDGHLSVAAARIGQILDDLTSVVPN